MEYTAREKIIKFILTEYKKGNITTKNGIYNIKKIIEDYVFPSSNSFKTGIIIGMAIGISFMFILMELS